MLWKGWNGIKTGVTPNAGPCLAASISMNEKN
jgi:D-alanyl-D-alanine carboxypeptidase